MAARACHVRKCLLSPSQDGQCPTRSTEQDHCRLECLNWALRVLEGCNKEGEHGRHGHACAAWLCLVCQASRPRRTLRTSAPVNVSIQASFEPSLSSFCDFPTSPYLPVLPSDPGRWRSHLCCAGAQLLIIRTASALTNADTVLSRARTPCLWPSPSSPRFCALHVVKRAQDIASGGIAARNNSERALCLQVSLTVARARWLPASTWT